ncbi:hypothetical protein Pme01_25590 [Planosporangium mesophilum]|uniref:Uncharacterized protein n=1 Tax=Planosporangium mesophilum TaxID=689768 RepID=A0A8J3TD41_9ACTN|nr:hypothetical protein Pme01_25590 [Planosporangium mesophilum]
MITLGGARTAEPQMRRVVNARRGYMDLDDTRYPDEHSDTTFAGETADGPEHAREPDQPKGRDAWASHPRPPGRRGGSARRLRAATAG